MEHLIKGSVELNKMFAALQWTAGGLRRDFGEVENLQQSLRGASDFVQKAANRIEESILSDLMLIRPSAGFSTPNIYKEGDGNNEFVLSLSGAANFVRGNSHFAISLAFRNNDETKIALVYNPITEKLYYAEAGFGAYSFTTFHSTKIKVSNLSVATDLIIAYGDGARDIELPGVQKRMTGCVALDLAYVAAGNFDAFISNPMDFAEIAAGDLLIREAGGTIKMESELIATNGKVLKDI